MDYTNKLHIIYGDAALGVQTKKFQYIFSYEKGGLESLKINNKEWLYRIPTPTFWRATTDNDRGNGFSVKAAQWLGADMFSQCSKIHLTVDDQKFDPLPIAPFNNQFSNHEYANLVKISFDYKTTTTPATICTITYVIDSSGHATIKMRYMGKKGLPSLPVLGMRFIMPTMATGFEYYGLSSETYPDRKAGAKKGVFRVKGLPVTKYLVPQENGMHMDTDKLIITRNTSLNNADRDTNDFQLEINKTDKPLNFSCLPYTAEEL